MIGPEHEGKFTFQVLLEHGSFQKKSTSLVEKALGYTCVIYIFFFFF